MTWLLFVLNIYGGQPTFVEMPNEEACQQAADISNNATIGVRAWCVPSGDWEGLE